MSESHQQQTLRHGKAMQGIFFSACRQRCTFLLLCLLIAGCAGGTRLIESSRPEAPAMLQLTGAGGSCDVVLEFPKGYTLDKDYPALLVVQGGWESPLPGLSKAARGTGFILARLELPSLAGDEKAGAPELEALLGCLDMLLPRLVAQYSVDPRRVVIAGSRQGAALAQKLACMRSHQTGGLVLVDPPAVPSGCRPVQSIPTVIFSSEPGPSQSATFWAHNNGCDTMPTQSSKGTVTRARYECELPERSVLRYVLSETPAGGDMFQAFPTAAWSALNFMARQGRP